MDPRLAQSTETLTDTGVTDAGRSHRASASEPVSVRSAPVSVSASSSAEIESVARQPEMKDEPQSIRWLGFALTEAVAFGTFIFGLIAFFL